MKQDFCLGDPEVLAKIAPLTKAKPGPSSLQLMGDLRRVYKGRPHCPSSSTRFPRTARGVLVLETRLLEMPEEYLIGKRTPDP